MKVKYVPSKWIREDDCRFDCGPYVSGARETRALLEELDAPKDRLDSLTKGYNGGIYNGPQFVRNYVQDPQFGVPFVSSSSMMWADLERLPLLRKKDAQSSKLSYLQLEKGMSLISCSGTIGRMAYVRPEMDGMWSSQDVLKVVPDSDKVTPGYIYAFLASKFGIPMVTSRTYGAIIQHLEPPHIADLPVPRLGEEIEQKVHDLVDEAARLRSAGATQRQNAIAMVEERLGWRENPSRSVFTAASALDLGRRMDAFYHSDDVASARTLLATDSRATTLGDVVDSVFEPNRGARSKVDDPAFGVPFLSSSQVFRLDPVGEYLVSRFRTPNFETFVLSECDLLLPRSGQLGGIIGRAVLPLPGNYGDAASEHLVRVRARTREDAMYLWAVFASRPGYLATIGTAYGSSIPSLDCELLSALMIPWWDDEVRKQIVAVVTDYIDGLSKAIVAEREAVALVESTIAKEAN